MQVTEVTSMDGQSLLSDQQCGPVRNTGWTDSAFVSRGSTFVGNEIAYYPTVAIDKQLNLGEVDAGDVAAIRGEIEFQLPAEVRSIRIEAPFNGQVVETDDVRVKFRDGSASSLSYQTSGDTRRILEVRALNANGQVLDRGSSMSSGVWFGSGKNVSSDFYGTVAAAEVVLAERFEPVSYQFELPGALPGINSDFPRHLPEATIATAGRPGVRAGCAGPRSDLRFFRTRGDHFRRSRICRAGQDPGELLHGPLGAVRIVRRQRGTAREPAEWTVGPAGQRNAG